MILFIFRIHSLKNLWLFVFLVRGERPLRRYFNMLPSTCSLRHAPFDMLPSTCSGSGLAQGAVLLSEWSSLGRWATSNRPPMRGPPATPRTYLLSRPSLSHILPVEWTSTYTLNTLSHAIDVFNKDYYSTCASVTTQPLSWALNESMRVNLQSIKILEQWCVASPLLLDKAFTKSIAIKKYGF